jgi:hypothetical protein
MAKKLSLALLLLSASICVGQGISWPPSTGNSAYTPAGTAYFPNMLPVQIFQTNLSVGDHALYTVPTGKKALASVSVHNTAGGATGSPATPKVSFDAGVTYLATNGTTTTSPQNTGNASILNWEYVFNAGDVIGLTTATNNGVNVFGTVYLFDATSPLKTVKLTSFSDGNNTLYTVPSGKAAFTVFGYGNIISGNANAPTMNAVTTATVTIKFNIVLSGGSVATTNEIFNASLATSINGPTNAITMAAGDFINVNTSAGASTSLAFVTVLEYTP